MHKNTSKKGFTLVEIMIVVVIIGLLAAMAIPAFQKVRQDSRESAVTNDARQLASAAQQYMLENNATTVAVTYNSTTGTIAAPLDVYVRKIGTGYALSSSLGIDSTFTIGHPQMDTDGNGSTVLTFTAEGQVE
ncbi:prepilin-type N-terminal cleavage/methylation domain-containing protein [Pelagicoccus sp. NFK12]|uniref:Prepilin-type N-terminal cleavage/methylation domain-containing protein n=1 Tax=Pelagicoccus enzymogenes TaxID=2773457 RepID=A0A927F5S2_9BACT|nr:prepilin-type N-terminal cleavage/methylation domain-containing protein [Pelagicoccus enzymogenes]MBD5778525.1 prepilin-type N-terminal cleavage/methylation domain-containing protein [Pelagicoccus enzymogenes]MDQ8197113.1 prepilin-type N-terminal cleavage/methylation domain-containing protein [Pelagicoccus enzymogenes]